MTEDEDNAPEPGDAANDHTAAEARIRAALVTIARLLGRQMAREQFEGRLAANDNRPAPTPKANQD